MHEVLPKSILTSLTAEDLRLMLCGCPHIDVEALRGITVFDDESRESPILPLSLAPSLFSISLLPFLSLLSISLSFLSLSVSPSLTLRLSLPHPPFLFNFSLLL